MKKKVLYLLVTAAISATAFIIGRNTNQKDVIALNSIVDYVSTSTGIILHTVDSDGNINGYILDIPKGVKEWAEKGYRGTED